MYFESGIESMFYTCYVCGRTHTLEGRNTPEIARAFDKLGWGNHPVERGEKIDYVVFCKEHNTADRLAHLAEYGSIYVIPITEPIPFAAKQTRYPPDHLKRS